MNDLVRHLRESATDLCSPGGCCYAESMVKAADEIERLRAELKTANGAIDRARAEIERMQASRAELLGVLNKLVKQIHPRSFPGEILQQARAAIERAEHHD